MLQKTKLPVKSKKRTNTDAAEAKRLKKNKLDRAEIFSHGQRKQQSEPAAVVRRTLSGVSVMQESTESEVLPGGKESIHSSFANSSLQNTSNIEAFGTEETPMSSISSSSTPALESDITEETLDEVEAPKASGDSTAPAVAVVPPTTAEFARMTFGAMNDDAAENLLAENIEQEDAVRIPVTDYLKKMHFYQMKISKGNRCSFDGHLKNIISNSKIQSLILMSSVITIQILDHDYSHSYCLNNNSYINSILSRRNCAS